MQVALLTAPCCPARHGLREPNSGCRQFQYDGLQNLTSEISYGYQIGDSGTCDLTEKVINEKRYRYSADWLVEITYQCLDEQGGSLDQGDAVWGRGNGDWFAFV